MKVNLKNNIWAISLLVLMMSVASILVLSGCSKDDASNPVALDINGTEVLGQWRVSQYLDSGDDETNDFSSITVGFSSDGEFIIFENNVTTMTGSWQVIQDDGVDKLDIVVPTDQKPFKDFDDDWIITGKTSTTISLLDDNSSSEESMMLEKI